MGVEAEVELHGAHAGITNHTAQAELVCRSVEQVLGPGKAVAEGPGMVSEDFGSFLLERPGCFYHIGVGGPAGLHSDRFCPEEWPLADAAAVHAQVVWNAMAEAQKHEV